MTEEMFQDSLQGSDSRSRGSLITVDESEEDDNNSLMESFDSTHFRAKKRRIGESRGGNGSFNVDGPPSRPKKTYKKAGKTCVGHMSRRIYLLVITRGRCKSVH